MNPLKTILIYLLIQSPFVFSASIYSKLVCSLQSSNSADQDNAAQLLRYKATNLRSHLDILHAGAIPAVAQLFKGKNKKVQESAYQLIHALSVLDGRVRKAIYEAGVLQVLSERICKTRSAETQIRFIKTLILYAQDDTDVREVLCKEGFTKKLISFSEAPQKVRKDNPLLNERAEKTLELLASLASGNIKVKKSLRRVKTESFMLNQAVNGANTTLKVYAEKAYEQIAQGYEKDDDSFSPELLTPGGKKKRRNGCAIL